MDNHLLPQDDFELPSDADTLSRLPLNIEDYMQTCCQGSSSEVVQAAICSVRLKSQGDLPWLTALTDSTAIDDEYNTASHTAAH